LEPEIGKCRPLLSIPQLEIVCFRFSPSRRTLGVDA
jgi:hypothetical protein